MAQANTKDFSNKRVWSSRPRKNDPEAVKKTGRVHAFVFHPRRAQLVGFLVKRPDVAWMFRRADEFVAFDGFALVDEEAAAGTSMREGDILISDEPGATGRSALKRIGVDLDDCVVWFGLPVMCKDGTALGYAESVEFDPATGRVVALETSEGSAKGALLGRRSIPGELVRGFVRGMGDKLWLTDDDDDNPNALGAILVADEARDAEAVGGAAAAAGEATAVATDKVKRTYKKVVRKVKPKAEDAAKVAGQAAKTAGEAVQKGAYATGRQIARTEGMFSNFKNEFKKAMQDDED